MTARFKELIILTLAVLISSSCAFAKLPADYVAHIDPFTTDGCSASPEGTSKDRAAWVHCCVEHDIAYWQGGSKARKLKADQKLRSCISKAGYNQIAKLYYYAVRAGGTPNLDTSWRWGYGWPYKIGYNELTSEQLQSVQQELEFVPQVVEEYLRNFEAEMEAEEATLLPISDEAETPISTETGDQIIAI